MVQPRPRPYRRRTRRRSAGHHQRGGSARPRRTHVDCFVTGSGSAGWRGRPCEAVIATDPKHQCARAAIVGVFAVGGRSRDLRQRRGHDRDAADARGSPSALARDASTAEARDLGYCFTSPSRRRRSTFSSAGPGLTRSPSGSLTSSLSACSSTRSGRSLHLVHAQLAALRRPTRPEWREWPQPVVQRPRVLLSAPPSDRPLAPPSVG